jgi:hypothetical protein
MQLQDMLKDYPALHMANVRRPGLKGLWCSVYVDKVLARGVDLSLIIDGD